MPVDQICRCDWAACAGVFTSEVPGRPVVLRVHRGVIRRDGVPRDRGVAIECGRRECNGCGALQIGSRAQRHGGAHSGYRARSDNCGRLDRRDHRLARRRAACTDAVRSHDRDDVGRPVRETVDFAAQRRRLTRGATRCGSCGVGNDGKAVIDRRTPDDPRSPVQGSRLHAGRGARYGDGRDTIRVAGVRTGTHAVGSGNGEVVQPPRYDTGYRDRARGAGCEHRVISTAACASPRDRVAGDRGSSVVLRRSEGH